MSDERVSWLGPRAPRLRRLRLRDAVILTSPIVLALGVLFAGALGDFLRARAFDDWWSVSTRLRNSVDQRVASLASLPRALAMRLDFDPGAGDPTVVDLRVPRALWSAWQSAPLESWGTWLDAELVRGNSFDAVKIRKRGDTSVHWLTEKKSFTLKTSRENLYKGFRRLAFSGKTPMTQRVSNSLGAEFGLMTPQTWLAPVFVNGRFYGLFRVTEPIDESFIRRRQRLPGDIFRGDAAERGEYYKGRPRGLFSNPAIWERVAFNGRPTAPPSGLVPLVTAVNGSTFADHQRLMALVDPDEIARMLAYLLVTGDPYHMSNVHNHFWYDDPSTGTMHPIPWDVRLRDLREPSPHPLNDSLRAFLRDPRIYDRTLELLAEKLAAGTLWKRARQLFEEAEERYGEYLAYERLRTGIPPVGSASQGLALLELNRQTLSARLAEAAVASHVEIGRDGPLIVDLEARGPAPALLVALELRGSAGAESEIVLYADRDLDGRRSSGDVVVPVRWISGSEGGRIELIEPLRLTPGAAADIWRIRAGTLAYRLFLETSDASLQSAQPVLRNALDQSRVEPEEWKRGAAIRAGGSWHPWRFAAAPGAAVRRLAGELVLEESIAIGAHETLELEPGTTLRLDPDVSIFAKGRIVARGTVDAPIELVAHDPSRPWGAVALQGIAASGSVFEFVHFAGGGGAELERVEYKGMVSVHGASDVVFRHCEFRDNLRSDDALNAVSSEVRVLDSDFVRVNADAVDFDHASGAICNSRFVDSANDAIDLMGSSPRIIGNEIRRSGDKGISIGEASHPWVEANRIAEGDVGSEVKDRSEPLFLSNLFHRNRAALLVNSKNWRYGGAGWPVLGFNALRENDADLELGRGARITRWEEETQPWPAAEAFVVERYGEDLGNPGNRWRAEGGVTRLSLGNGGLEASVSVRAGSLARSVDWPASGDRRARAIFEIGGQGFSSAEIVLRSESGITRRAIKPTADASRFRSVAIELVEGRTDEVRIVIEPDADGAHLALHEMRVEMLPLSAGGERAGGECRNQLPDGL